MAQNRRNTRNGVRAKRIQKWTEIEGSGSREKIQDFIKVPCAMSHIRLHCMFLNKQNKM